MLDHATTAVRQDARTDPSSPRSTAPDLSVLVPTRDEADNSDDITPTVIRTTARRSLCGLRFGLESPPSSPAAGAPVAELLVPMPQEVRTR
jgi:hypothetical protein